MRYLRRFLNSEEGPTSVEYAVMLAMILGLVISAIGVLGTTTTESFEYSKDEIDRVFPDFESGDA
ncbi:MAG: Flp family type IVb pilin [Pirellulales bacterium]